LHAGQPLEGGRLVPPVALGGGLGVLVLDAGVEVPDVKHLGPAGGVHRGGPLDGVEQLGGVDDLDAEPRPRHRVTGGDVVLTREHLAQDRRFQVAADIEALAQLLHPGGDSLGQLAHRRGAEPPDDDAAGDHNAERQHEPALDAVEVFAELAHRIRLSRRVESTGGREWFKLPSAR